MYTHVCKYKNNTCWNCSRNQGRGEGVEKWRGGTSNMICLIHCKNLCKCYNVPTNNSQREYKWPINIWEMFNIPSHKRNASQNIIEFVSHPSQNVFNQENKNKFCQRCVGKGTLIHCWWECKLVQPLWKST
jgi:hypothetical protein